MTEENKPQTITLDDKEYIIDDLSNEAKYMIELMTSLQSKERNLLMEMDQIKAAQETIVAKFKLEVKKDA
jgi:hypothetical protein